MTDATTFTVSGLTLRIKQTLEQHFGEVTVEGEVSNFKLHTSGHCYFTLKDEQAQISAVLWRSRAAGLFFTPENGMRVTARGSVTVYPVRGVYQIDVISLRPAGAGELQAAFERLKRKLFDEGLFDQNLKLPLPEYPMRIGLVTSGTGAAIRDMLQVLERRAPYLEVLLIPVRVQGEGSAREIAAAIRDFNEYGGVDLLIVGRGGGSIEDLWAFNEEVVARAIAASQIPVISAVGHEVDYTIADFVADLRAPTPSAAAELAAPSRAEIIENLAGFSYTARKCVESALRERRQRIRGYLRSYAFNLPADVVKRRAQRIDELTASLTRLTGYRTGLLRHRLDGLRSRLTNLDPARILARGFAMVSRDGRTVDSAAAIHAGDTLRLRFHDGGVSARALGGAEEEKGSA